GGIGMWPVLVFGLVLVGAAARYAWSPHPARVRFLVVLSILLVVVMLHSMLINTSKVLWFLDELARDPAAPVVRVAFKGLKESGRPGLLGGGLLGLALVLAAVGAYRSGLRELRAARAG